MIMKKFDSKFVKQSAMVVLSVVILGAGAFVTNVRAQASGAFEIQIPFEFVVNNRTYEAGTYRVGRLSAANPDMLILQTGNGKKSLILLTKRDAGGAPITISKLTFSRYGEIYFLDTIRAPGASYESRIIKSNRRSDGRGQLTETVSVTEK